MFVRLLTMFSFLFLTAQLPAQAPMPKELPKGKEPPSPFQVISLTITPASVPKPALKYVLLPSFYDLSSGDALGSYLKCFAEQNNFYYSKEGRENFGKYPSMKFSELPHGLDTFGGKALRNADAAARLDHIDWVSVTALKRDGIGTLLPEVQQMREIGAALKIRARGQIKAGKYPEAISTVQTMFSLARHLDQHPTIIGNLVGGAISMVAFQPLEEMMEQPGSPNLVWAYAYLPNPLLDFRHGLEGERLMVQYEFAPFDDRDKVWDEETARKAQAKWDTLLDLMLNESMKEQVKKGRESYQKQIKDPKWLEGCRTRLIALGYDPAKVAKFPKEQLMLHDILRKVEEARDDYFKYAKLPYSQYEALDIQVPSFKDADDAAGNLLLEMNSFFPRYRAVKVRLSQRIAQLQTIEAIRDYAAQNGGKLPGSLKDIKLVLPLDPVNDKAFEYTVQDGKATLKGGVAKGGTGFVIYELQMKK